MEQETLYFGENGIIKSLFYKNKRPININEVDIEETVLSYKKSYSKDSFKYFIGYRYKGNALSSPLSESFLKCMHIINILIKIINT